jgi:hypothetical protein
MQLWHVIASCCRGHWGLLCCGTLCSLRPLWCAHGRVPASRARLKRMVNDLGNSVHGLLMVY